MKKHTLLILLVILSISLKAQVGIGTETPFPGFDLHVEGDLLIQDGLKVNGIPKVTPTESNFKLLTRSKNSSPIGELKRVDVDEISVAPITEVDYQFNNIAGDEVRDVDTQLDASKYIVSISNFRQFGGAVLKKTVESTKSIGNFIVRTFQSGGTWHIEIRNENLDQTGNAILYRTRILIYDRKYYRSLPKITTDLGGNNSGDASSVPVFD